MTENTPPSEAGDETGSTRPDVEALLRELTEADLTLDTPPAGLWADIAAAAEVTSGDAAGAMVSSEVRASEPAGNVTSLAHRRFRRATPARILTAAAAVVVLILGVLAVTQSRTDDARMIASASLRHDAAAFDPLGAQATAAVSLRDEGDTLVLSFDEASLPDVAGEQADLELWLIRPDTQGGVADLVSLGVIDAGRPGSITIPTSVDPDEFFVVDISIEPRDGDETHSGRSILRGPLDA